MTIERPVPDPFKRAEILAWLAREGFQDFKANGYYDKAYSLSHGYAALRVGVPPGQICATVTVVTGGSEDERAVYLGEAYTVAPIAALWAVLNLFDFDEGRGAAFWRDYHVRRYPA